MKDRILQSIWFVLMAIAVLIFVILPTYQFGFVGWCAGIGLLLHVIILTWLAESLINYIVNGEFKPDDWDDI